MASEFDFLDLTPKSVPCGNCTACCHGMIAVLPEFGDDPTDYETEWTTNPLTGNPLLQLKQKPDGSCHYLDGGCTIYDSRPAICKGFDCRPFARQFLAASPAERREMVKYMSAEVFRAGTERDAA